MTCPKCNNSNELDATFCTVCGQPLALQSQYASTAAPAPNYGYAPTRSASPPSPSTEIEALNYSRYVDLLCEGQGFLAQLAIRFSYVTGLKTYQVTHHDCFVVPNVRRDSAEIIAHIKREMDGLGYQELLTTFLYMKTEHIQTLPYLSQCVSKMAKGGGEVSSNNTILMILLGGVRLFVELFWGFAFLIVDFVKWLGRVLSQSAGATIRTVGRVGNDEMLTGNRLLLASTYRHTRTYTYVRDVGPETYVGWFTHHEPPQGMLSLFAPMLLYFVGTFFAQFYIRMLLGPFAGLTGSRMSFLGPLSIVFGIGGILYVFWLAPWLLNRLGALPQPRYISSMVFVLWALLGLFGAALFASRMEGGFGYNDSSPDTFMMILSATVTIATAMLLFAGLIVFIRVLFWPTTHYDQFDAETHAKIIEQRIATILAESLESAGYSANEIADILSQKSPGAGRYRRARV
ncbi:MAG: zinc ribbon domain-containing protein [Acidobacteria bacterium]|nr:zinc ribbon domain-containing protein [Acidobacteriota bacterium]